jgi:hypothetical protein
MGTTSLVVELLIIGFQVTIWVVLLLLSAFGYKWIDFSLLTSWAGLITIAFLAASYSLALVFDTLVLAETRRQRIARYKWPAQMVTQLKRESGITSDRALPAMMRTYIVARNPALEGYITRMTYGFRLLTATTLNLVLICMATLVFLATRIGLTWNSLVVTLLIFLVPALLSAYATATQFRNYHLELGLMYLAIRAPRAAQHETASRGRSRLRRA